MRYTQNSVFREDIYKSHSIFNIQSSLQTFTLLISAYLRSALSVSLYYNIHDLTDGCRRHPELNEKYSIHFVMKYTIPRCACVVRR
jgi:hypothetical protein